MASRPGARRLWRSLGPALAAAALLGGPGPVEAHPMGNFSISHYAGLRVERDAIRVRYLIDMAEIPTFQAIQEAGLSVEPNHPSLGPYLRRTAATLRDGLRLDVSGQPLELVDESREGLFTPGAGGLPTLKIAIVYRAALAHIPAAAVELQYRDDNYPDRAGWKEVIATAGSGVRLVESSVPGRDRSGELSDYPTDLLNSPPQVLSARVAFEPAPGPAIVRSGPEPPAEPGPRSSGGAPRAPTPVGTTPTGTTPAAPTPAGPIRAATTPTATTGTGTTLAAPAPAAPSTPSALATKGAAPTPSLVEPASEPVRLVPNRRGTPRDTFTQLIAMGQLGPGVVALALVVAASLGAFHALEPGHGKTVVAAYLVGSRGTAWHAVVLGLVVTASHTAGVYLLGGLTLYASRYVVPERLYPWLGAISGLTIAVLGLVLFLKRYAGGPPAHDHQHGDHGHGRPDQEAHHHGHGHEHGHHHHGHHRHHRPEAPVSLRALLALGVTGGIVPCPAALVVLLSAVALRRVGFGLLLIVAFSVGLAAVLVGIGLLMVYARRFMARFQGDGRLVARWLPLTSAAVIALAGAVIAVQALTSAGIVQIRL
ncbi:MAG: hypothetical protein DMD79_00370 [Candidatus Rokuibacteriota bacterium]|nr:MAG: hypothetical protein DMD79_00370 [Candidatus Rokubacteria bacterium]